MQIFFLIVAASVCVLVVFAGCDKHADATTQPSQQAFNGVQFCSDFESAPSELKALADKAWRSILTENFPVALKCLDQLAADPALNTEQKKSVASLTEQVKKQMALSTARQL